MKASNLWILFCPSSWEKRLFHQFSLHSDYIFPFTAQKMKFSIKEFFSNGKLHFLCSDYSLIRLVIRIINRIRWLIIFWACEPCFTKVMQVLGYRFLHILLRKYSAWIPFLSYVSCNSGSFLDRMFTFQLFCLAFLAIFLSEMIAEDYPAFSGLTDSVLK